MLLVFKNHANPKNILFRKKPYNQICFQLPPYTLTNDLDKEETGISNIVSWQNYGEDWMNVFSLCLSLNMSQIARVLNPANMYDLEDKSTYVFRSHNDSTTSTTTGGMPLVKCYSGVSDGVLYPMQEGVLFFK